MGAMKQKHILYNFEVPRIVQERHIDMHERRELNDVLRRNHSMCRWIEYKAIKPGYLDNVHFQVLLDNQDFPTINLPDNWFLKIRRSDRGLMFSLAVIDKDGEIEESLTAKPIWTRTFQRQEAQTLADAKRNHRHTMETFFMYMERDLFLDLEWRRKKPVLYMTGLEVKSSLKHYVR